MDVEDAKQRMVDAMNAETEALRSYQQERKGLPSWENLLRARQHTRAMVDEFIRAQAEQPNESTPTL